MDIMPDEPQYPEGPMSARAFAGLRGVTHPAILKAIKAGRMGAGVRDGRIANARLAAEELDRNTDPIRVPPAAGHQPRSAMRPVNPSAVSDDDMSDPEDMNEARRRLYHEQARMARLKYLQQAGELVSAKDVEGQLRKVFSECRTELLGIPAAIKQALQGQLDEAGMEKIDAMILRALERLADTAMPQEDE